MFMDIKVGVIMNKQFYKEELGGMIAENGELKLRISVLEKQVLDLTLENAELKDKVLDLGGEYEEEANDRQLDLFNVSK